MKAKQPTSFAGVAGKVRRPRSVLGAVKVVLAVLVVSALAFGAWRVYDKHRNDEIIKNLGGVKPTGKITTAKEEEKSGEKLLEQNLEKGDIDSYQVGKLSIVYGYLIQKDYANASRVLAEIKANIPGDKLQPQFYYYALQIDEQTGNKQSQKDDLQSLINLLKSKKLDSQVAFYQKQLDALNGKAAAPTPALPSNSAASSLN